jgi:hypothetical protein
MPLINGACAPALCFTITYNVAAADVEIFDTRRGVVDANRTAGVRQAQLFAGQVQAYKAKYANPLVQKCDGCACIKTPAPFPPAPMLPEDIPQVPPPPPPPAGVPPPPPPRFQPRINGGMFTMHLGWCLPPGTRIRFPGGTWITAQADARPREEYAMFGAHAGTKGAKGKKDAKGKKASARARRRRA